MSVPWGVSCQSEKSILDLFYAWLSRLGLQNTPTVSLLWDKTSPNECPGNGSKNSDGKVPVMLELWGMLVMFWPFDPAKNAIHQKEVIHSNGGYERKSHGRKLADELGRGKNIPWYSHRLTHRKRVTSELHDSYFRLMTIKHSISKIQWAIV